MTAPIAQDKESAKTRITERVAHLRRLWEAGEYGDALPVSRLVGLPRSTLQVRRRFLEEIASWEALTPAESAELRGLRVEVLDEVDALLSIKLAEVANQGEMNADAFAEGMAWALAASGRLQTHLTDYRAFREDTERDLVILHGIIQELVGKDRYDAAVSTVEKELSL